MAEFYVDHDVSIHVVPELRARGHQARCARDIGAAAHSDPQRLLIAASQSWILVSHNKSDFRLLHLAWDMWARAWGVTPSHAGILILPHGDAADSARLLDEHISARPLLENRMYEYRGAAGWVPWP
ncbi:MAG: DUF5615 family PIN-like protein [Chloroflexi bacterium]|nr:DUF5615 family PIN-like protein [Chloroflexota bacterium]